MAAIARRVEIFQKKNGIGPMMTMMPLGGADLRQFLVGSPRGSISLEQESFSAGILDLNFRPDGTEFCWFRRSTGEREGGHVTALLASPQEPNVTFKKFKLSST